MTSGITAGVITDVITAAGADADDAASAHCRGSTVGGRGTGRLASWKHL